MTLFDDIQNEIDAGIEDIGFPTEGYHHIMKASEMIDKLHEEYAPTVEMTSDQKENFLMMKNNKFSLIEIVAEFDDGNLINDFDGYWNPLNESQLVQAWLHPETIKIVDE